MNTNELRMGNWVNLYMFNGKTKYWQVVEIGEEDMDDCSPIPLTPEILEKAGFVKFRDSSYFYFKQVQIGLKEIEISVNPENGIVFYDAENQVKLPIRYTYLHQLQNLYFALTGEELQIEL